MGCDNNTEQILMITDKEELSDFITNRLYDSELNIKRWESCGRYGEYELVSHEVLATYIHNILNEYEETKVSN